MPDPCHEIGLEPRLAVQRLERRVWVSGKGELRKTCLQVAVVPKIFPK